MPSKQSVASVIGAFVCLVVAVPARPDVFMPISQPTPQYLATNLFTLSDLTDRQSTKNITMDDFTVNFTAPLVNWPGMVDLTIPISWAGWGAPPAVEKTKIPPLPPCLSPFISQCPPVLWTGGPTVITLNLSTPALVFGFEAEPNVVGPETLTAQFYGASGPIGTIQRDPSGYFGASLFAASSTTPITRVVVTDLSNDDFAIANVRFQMVPEPNSTLLVGIGLLAIGATKKSSPKSP
jgi:hypothetical protein